MDVETGVPEGENTQADPETQESTTQTELSDAIKAFAKAKGLSTDDHTAIAEALLDSRKEEIEGRKAERKKRQELESNFNKLALDKILGSTEITDESRKELQAMADKALQVDQIGAALDTLVKHGGLKKEVLAAIAAGPAAIDAAFAMRGETPSKEDGTKALADEVMKHISPEIGVGADVNQQKSTGKKDAPQSMLAKLGLAKDTGLTPRAGEFVKMLGTQATQRANPADK